MNYINNPQLRRAHDKYSGQSSHEAGGSPTHGKGGGSHPHIAVHSHSAGHTVHITHPDGRHESHDHAAGDAEGIAAHIHQHIGGQEESAPLGNEAGAPVDGAEMDDGY